MSEVLRGGGPVNIEASPAFEVAVMTRAMITAVFFSSLVVSL